MERSNYSFQDSPNNSSNQHSSQNSGFKPEKKSTLAENIWTAISIFIIILVIGSFGDDINEVEAEATVMIIGLVLGLLGLIVKGFSKANK